MSLSSATASSIVIHGLAMSIENTGVLILGDPGSGKSEAALGLLDRGHFLISDDAVELKADHNRLIATPPKPLCQQLQLNSIGLINPEKHFGALATAKQTAIDLVIKLTLEKAVNQALAMPILNTQYVNLSVPLIHLHRHAHCSLALKLETLVKQFRLLTQKETNELDLHL